MCMTACGLHVPLWLNYASRASNLRRIQPGNCGFTQFVKTLESRRCSSSRRFVSTAGQSSRKCSFGICFDIDGVIARGHVPLKESVQAFDLLGKSLKYGFTVPVAFVTNALGRHSVKAEQLSSWLKSKVEPGQMVMAQSAIETCHHLRNKHCLMVGQGPISDIAKDLGLTNTSTIQDVTSAYPLLDVGCHDIRKRVADGDFVDKELPGIEVIVIMGEPDHWETSLQVLIDLLLTAGKPSHGTHRTHTQTLPIIACNQDLHYMHKSNFPRFGNGAFLHCLEGLFQKLTGKPLMYSKLFGKPSEATFRYAEHVLTRECKLKGYEDSIKTMYMVGDNHEVDILGANLYQKYLDHIHGLSPDYSIPAPRIPLPDSDLSPQTATKSLGILLRTGVFQGDVLEEDIVQHSHRDFTVTHELLQPHVIVDNVLDAVKYILSQEKVL